MALKGKAVDVSSPEGPWCGLASEEGEDGAGAFMVCFSIPLACNKIGDDLLFSACPKTCPQVKGLGKRKKPEELVAPRATK
jgi:hypothetical protein